MTHVEELPTSWLISAGQSARIIARISLRAVRENF